MSRAIIESMMRPLYQVYSSTERKWSYQGMAIAVLPEVFHPGWFVTSGMLLDRLERTELAGKRFLELGCGTGTQACRAAKLGAKVYASDVLPAACKNTVVNSEKNEVDVTVILSDIFDQMPLELLFDVIFVNPPFIARYPEEDRDFAFCCGEEYEYFISMFGGLNKFLAPGGFMIMSLARSCDVERIIEIAESANFEMERIDTTQRWSETNYLFRCTLKH